MLLRTLIFLGLFLSTLSFAAPPKILEHVCTTYVQCREKFVAAAKEVAKDAPGARFESKKVKSEKDQDLTIDFFYLPPTDRETRLLVMSSGVHGVEGFTGSAVQHLFLKKLFGNIDRKNTGVLLIHGINPYGFKYLRRVSEYNVDLNRSFEISEDLFKVQNEGYDKLYPILNPKGPPSRSILSYANFYWQVGKLLLSEPLKTLRQATLQGQYKHEDGLYFGGKEFQEQKGIIEPLLLDIAKPYKNVLVFDIHTGYGDRGVLHLFPNPTEDQAIKDAIKVIFADYKIDEGGGDDFYTTYGDFSAWTGKLLAKENKLAVPMTLEYGTINNTGYYGSIESLRRMIAENQLYQAEKTKPGSTDPYVMKQIRNEVVEMYFPSSAWWRQKTLDDAAKQLPIWIGRFQKEMK